MSGTSRQRRKPCKICFDRYDNGMTTRSRDRPGSRRAAGSEPRGLPLCGVEVFRSIASLQKTDCRPQTNTRPQAGAGELEPRAGSSPTDSTNSTARSPMGQRPAFQALSRACEISAAHVARRQDAGIQDMPTSQPSPADRRRSAFRSSAATRPRSPARRPPATSS